MNKENQKPIDQYFKEVLESPDLKFNKQDWKGFEQMFPQSEKRRFGWWIPASVAAAILLIFGSIWFFNGSDSDTEKLAGRDRKPKEAGMSDKVNTNRQNQKSPAIGELLKYREAERKAENLRAHKNENVAPFKAQGHMDMNRLNSEELNARKAGNHGDELRAALLGSPLVLQSENKSLINGVVIGLENINSVSSERAGNKKEIKDDPNSKSKFSLALSFSPDFNSVSSFSNSSFGTSFSIGAGYRITPSLTVNTAIGYSKKVYTAEPYEYKAPWANIAAKYNELIDADCRVLDVPVNLNYTVSKTARRTVFAEAGISSYFMLKEKYTLVDKDGQSGYPGYPDISYSYKNKNQHLLSVVNLSVGLAKPLSKQTSLVIAPYARLPLTGIGQGKVNLQSVGLNFQLQYNFRKKRENPSTLINAAQ
jgi:hypothetical protein